MLVSGFETLACRTQPCPGNRRHPRRCASRFLYRMIKLAVEPDRHHGVFREQVPRLAQTEPPRRLASPERISALPGGGGNFARRKRLINQEMGKKTRACGASPRRCTGRGGSAAADLTGNRRTTPPPQGKREAFPGPPRFAQRGTRWLFAEPDAVGALRESHIFRRRARS